MGGPRILFIPVSSSKGIGEYVRSLIIAGGVKRRWRDADLHFVLSRRAPYAQQCPYTVHLTKLSPTKHVREVNQIISRLQPELVVFDASGRKAQLRHANRMGIPTVFISQHPRKRRRGFRLGRLRHTSRHWIVQPKLLIGDLTLLERLKLRILTKPEPLFLGVVFSEPSPERQQALLTEYRLQPGRYLLFSAGSGGHKLGNGLAADQFAAAAAQASGRFGEPCVMVYGPNYAHPIAQQPGVIGIKQLTSEAFTGLLQHCTAAVLSGGSALMQALALRKPVLALPVSPDQPARVRACVSAGLAQTCAATPQAIESALDTLLKRGGADALLAAQDELGMCNGLHMAIEDIDSLLKTR